MENSIEKNIVFLLYYALGVIGSLFLTAYPLIYKDKGYDERGIAILISIGFLMAILKPLFGYITDRFYTDLKMLKLSFLIVALSCVAMYFSTSLFIMALIVNSIFRAGMNSFLDSYITKHPEQFEMSYAKMRTGVPIGFATAFIFGEIFINIFNLSISGMLLFIAIICVLSYIGLFFIEDFEHNGEGKIKKIIVEERGYDVQGLVTLLVYGFLYCGIYQISSSYLSIYLTEFGYSTFLIGLLNLCMIVPQLFLMFSYDKTFGKIRNSTLLCLSGIFGTIQGIIYVFMPSSVVLLVIASMLSGIQLVILPAGFYPNLTKSLKSTRVSTGLTMNATLQSIWVGVFNVVFVSRIYSKFNTTISVYVIVIIFMLISILPLFVYRKKHKDD